MKLWLRSTISLFIGMFASGISVLTYDYFHESYSLSTIILIGLVSCGATMWLSLFNPREAKSSALELFSRMNFENKSYSILVFLEKTWNVIRSIVLNVIFFIITPYWIFKKEIWRKRAYYSVFFAIMLSIFFLVLNSLRKNSLPPSTIIDILGAMFIFLGIIFAISAFTLVFTTLYYWGHLFGVVFHDGTDKVDYQGNDPYTDACIIWLEFGDNDNRPPFLSVIHMIKIRGWNSIKIIGYVVALPFFLLIRLTTVKKVSWIANGLIFSAIHTSLCYFKGWIEIGNFNFWLSLIVVAMVGAAVGHGLKRIKKLSEFRIPKLIATAHNPLVA